MGSVVGHVTGHVMANANKFVCTAIIRLSVSSLVNVSIRKINVGKGFLPDGHNGLP